MVRVIFIHVIIEVIDISLTSNACLSRQVHFNHFHFVIVSILVEWLVYEPTLNSNNVVVYGQKYKVRVLVLLVRTS